MAASVEMLVRALVEDTRTDRIRWSSSTNPRKQALRAQVTPDRALVLDRWKNGQIRLSAIDSAMSACSVITAEHAKLTEQLWAEAAAQDHHPSQGEQQLAALLDELPDERWTLLLPRR